MYLGILVVLFHIIIISRNNMNLLEEKALTAWRLISDINSFGCEFVTSGIGGKYIAKIKYKGETEEITLVKEYEELTKLRILRILFYKFKLNITDDFWSDDIISMIYEILLDQEIEEKNINVEWDDDHNKINVSIINSHNINISIDMRAFPENGFQFVFDTLSNISDIK
jgi:hypothetical protein